MSEELSARDENVLVNPNSPVPAGVVIDNSLVSGDQASPVRQGGS